jgi:hypothetical protein
MSFVWIEGRPVWDGQPNPEFKNIDGVVVNRKTGEEYLLQRGTIVRRMGAMTANCPPSGTSTSILKPAFRRSTDNGQGSQQTRQRPLVLPTMNAKGELEYDDEDVDDLQPMGQQPLPLPEMNFEDDYTTNPYNEYDDEDGQLVNTRAPLGQQQEALLPPSADDFEDEDE